MEYSVKPPPGNIPPRGAHHEETTLSGPADTSGSKNAIQAIGSTLTYLQRYSLVQMLGLAAADEMRKFALAVIACLVCSNTEASDLWGFPRVVDGDTLAIGAIKIRLEGIDAPETDQVCLDAHASPWTCGIEGRNQLASYVAGQAIKCVSNGTDRYGRNLATCWLGARNLNGWMVEQGWALAYIPVFLCVCS